MVNCELVWIAFIFTTGQWERVQLARCIYNCIKRGQRSPSVPGRLPVSLWAVR